MFKISLMHYPPGGGVVKLHPLMVAILGIGVFALIVGAGPAFADHHVGDITLHTKDTIADTPATYLYLLDTLDTIKIGDKYYLMTGGRSTDRGFQVLDITDPSNIRVEGNATALQNIFDVNFHQIGTNIYALTASQGTSGIQIINVTNPSAPTVVATIRQSGAFSNLDEPRNVDAIQIGDHHYALATSQRDNVFLWINITNVTAPTHVFTGTDVQLVGGNAANGRFTDIEDAKAFFFRQHGSNYYAYIAGSSGVQIVNLTNPASPTAGGRETGFGNEPHMITHHQVGSKEYLIASVASEDNPQLWIKEITGAPVYPLKTKVENGRVVIDTDDRTRATIRVADRGTNLQDLDIFEMEGRTYLVVTSRSDVKGFTFYDITDPTRPVREAQIRENAHGFSTLTGVRAVSAIDIDDDQYVAVGGDEGITLMHVHPYGKPIMNIVSAGGATVSGTAPNFNVDLPSGATELSFTASVKYTPDADDPVIFNVTKAVYTQGHRVASSSSVEQTITFNHTHTSVTVPPINMTHYPVKKVYLEEILINATHRNYTTVERIHYVAHDWANEYALILLATNSTQHVFEGRLVTSIHVTGSSQSSPTQEEGVLRLPTRIALSLDQISVSEDVGTVNITATLDAPAPPDGASVSLYSSGGNATEGTDYTLPASIYIPAGERSGSASITISDDTVVESDESASISAYVDILGQEMTDSITLTITDDDTAVVEQDNRIPTVSAAIADVIIQYEGGTKTISLSGVFSDADNDSLNITASSSDATKASVSVASDYTGLTLTGKAKGTATITVTADDGNGGTVSDVFTITVKAAPTVSSAISDISGMSIGDNQDISLDGVFRDADNDSLNVTASTSDYNIAEAIIFQDTLTIIAVGNGSATITVTAQDTDGNGATDTFEVAVGAQQQQRQNRAPTISAAIANVTIPYEGGTRTISLSGVFSDADNDSLNVTATSSDATKAGVSVASDHTSLTLSGKARGTATITVTADDGNGGTVSDAFTITVKAAPTVSSAISDASGLDAGDSRTISLAGVFDDADRDSLTITAESSNDTVATVEAASDGSALTLTAQAPGTATITVTAQDTDGNQATDTFEVTVGAQQQTADTSGLEPIVAQYDTDGSGAIEQDEWEVAVEDHANGKLTNKEIFAISQARSYN